MAEALPARPAVPAARPNIRVLGVVTSGHFVNDFFIAFLSPLLPLVVMKFDLSLTLAGLLATILTASAALSQPLFGLVADRMRRAWLVAAGPTLTVVAMGAIGLAPSYAFLVILLLLAGIGSASFHPQAAATAGFASGPRKGAGLSLFVAGGELGFALGPVTIALIVSAYGLPGTWLAAVPGLIACALLWANISGTSLSPTQRPPMEADEFRRIFRALALLWLIVVLRSVLVHSYTSFLPLLLAERGASILAGGAAVFVFGGVGTLGGLIGGPLSDRIGRRATLALSFLVGGPALFAFTQLEGPAAFVFLGLGGMALYLSAAVTVVMAQELLPHRASVASSIVMGLAWGTAGLTLTGTGALADAVGLTSALTAILVLAVIPPVLLRYLPARADQGLGARRHALPDAAPPL